MGLVGPTYIFCLVTPVIVQIEPIIISVKYNVLFITMTAETIVYLNEA